MNFIARRVLALGVLFLLSPVWCWPFVNDLAIKLVEQKIKNPASGWLAFTAYDSDIQVLIYRTTMILYFSGVWITCLAGILLALGTWSSRGSRDR
jgi:hypothetical protein